MLNINIFLFSLTVRTFQMNDAVLAYEISLIHAAAVRDKNVKRLSKLAAHSTGYAYNKVI